MESGSGMLPAVGHAVTAVTTDLPAVPCRAPVVARRVSVPENPCVAGTCIPIAFANDGIRAAASITATVTTVDADFLDTMISATVGAGAGAQPLHDGAARRSLDNPEAACSELPLDVFPHSVLYDFRPRVLPEGFSIVPTPTEYGNVLVTPGVDGKPRKQPWHSNLYGLVLPGSSQVIIGRHLRIGNTPACKTGHQYRLLEGIFFSYSIKFHMGALDTPGVRFFPVFLPPTPQDPNYWARQSIDCTLAANTVPPTPPGWFIPFARLPKTQSITHVSNKQLAGYTLTSTYAGVHPVIRGDRVFPPLDGTADEKSTYQDGGIGFVVYRPNFEELGVVQEDAGLAPPVHSPHSPRQTAMLYARVAFTADALAGQDVQLSKINAAIQFALANSPTDRHGMSWVNVATTAAFDTAVSDNMYGTIFEVPPGDMRRVLETTTDINAVDKQRDVLTVITRSIMTVEKRSSFEEAHTEARFRVALANQLATLPQYPDSDMCVVMPVLYDSDAYKTVVASDIAGTVTDDASACYVHQERVFSSCSFVGIMEQHACAVAAVKARSALSSCSPIINDIAPPDERAYGDKKVVILGFGIDVRLGASESVVSKDAQRRYRRIAGDIVTRFMWDMMMYDPSLCVVSTVKETLLRLETDKAPGLLCVKSTRDSVPVKKTNTSDHRRTRNPHPALPNFSVETVTTAPKPPRCAPIPDLSDEEVRTNPFFNEWIQGTLRPTGVSGCLATLYLDGSANRTMLAGTCHSWCVYGALLNKLCKTPRSAAFPWGYFGPEVTLEQRTSALHVLFAPLYNAAQNEIYKKDGRWAHEDATRRQWNKAYGMSLQGLHWAAGWRSYPSFASEYAEPRAVHIWELKKMVVASLQFALRYGRILRPMLSNHRRKIRCDYPIVIFRNYFYDTKKRFPNAPVARMFVSALNAYKDRVILGEQPPRTHRKVKLPGAAMPTNTRRTAVHCDGSDEDDDEHEHDAGIDTVHSGRIRAVGGAGFQAGAGVGVGGAGAVARVCVDDEDEDDGDGDFDDVAVDPMAAMYGVFSEDYDEITTSGMSALPRCRPGSGSGGRAKKTARMDEDDDDLEDFDEDDDEDDDEGDDDVFDRDRGSAAAGTVAERMFEVSSVVPYDPTALRFRTRVATHAMEPGSVFVRPMKRSRVETV